MLKEDESPKLIAREFKDINDKSNFEENTKYNNRNNYNSKKTINKNPKLGIYIKVDSFSNKELLDNIVDALNLYPGDENIFLFAEDTRQMYKYNGLTVEISTYLTNHLEKIIPKENIKIKN